LRTLYLVAPQDYPSPEATDRAVGADDVLQSAVICSSLDEALKDCQLVIGTSARQRRIEWPTLDPATGALRLIDSARRAPVALLFGQERTGLINSELDRCHFMLSIPADKQYSSLNQAFLAGTHAGTSAAPEANLVSHADMQGFYRHLEEMLQQIGFLDPENPRYLMRRLMRLFNRTGLDQNELNILRGILTAVQQSKINLDKNSQE